jgi:Glutaredoxin-like domain (DUF836)
VRLQLLTRPECGLCEEFQSGLARFLADLSLPLPEIVDVDSDPVLSRRFGLDIPVLLMDGAKVCQHRFDPLELQRLLRPR